MVNNLKGERETFRSIRKAAEFMSINQSYLTKSIKTPGFYLDDFWFIHFLRI